MNLFDIFGTRQIDCIWKVMWKFVDAFMDVHSSVQWCWFVAKLDVLITPSTQLNFTQVDQLLCTTSVPQMTATYSWRDIVTNNIIGNEDRLVLNTSVNPDDCRNTLGTKSFQCTASVHHELVGTVTASSNISFNVSVGGYCNKTTIGQLC